MLPAAHAKRGRSCRRQGFFHMENIVNSFNSLYKAYRKTRCGKRDNPTAMRYRMEAIERTADLSDRLQRREYTFGPYYPFKVYEPKERLVLAIDFEGKVVQHSLCDKVLLHPAPFLLLRNGPPGPEVAEGSRADRLR